MSTSTVLRVEYFANAPGAGFMKLLRYWSQNTGVCYREDVRLAGAEEKGEEDLLQERTQD